jgi:hypothetical protein
MEDFSRRMDDDVQRLLSSAQEAARAILARRAEMDRAGLQDQPLIVLASESHDKPGHAAFRMLVAEILSHAEKIAVAHEERHNALDVLFSRERGMERPDTAQSAALHALDRDGSLSLKGLIGTPSVDWNTTATLPDVRAMELHHLLAGGIPFRCTDAATARMQPLTYEEMLGARDYSKQFDLDMNDSSTATAIRACFNDTAREELTVFTAAGVAVRNLHMARSVLDLATDSGARIVIQQCGNAHVRGDAENDVPVSQSLIAKLKGMGAAVMAMLDMEEGKKLAAADPSLKAEEQICIDIPAGARRDEMRTNGGEASYFCALLKNCGLEKAALTPETLAQKRHDFRAEVSHAFSGLPQTPRPRPSRFRAALQKLSQIF